MFVSNQPIFFVDDDEALRDLAEGGEGKSMRTTAPCLAFPKQQEDGGQDTAERNRAEAGAHAVFQRVE